MRGIVLHTLKMADDLQLVRVEEKHYLRTAFANGAHDWYGPLTDTEYNAFMRLMTVKPCDEP